MWIDSHCHLVSRRFASEEDAVIARAEAAGVGRMIVPATDLEDGPRALDLAERNAGVFVAVGIHPCEVMALPAAGWLEAVERWSHHEKVVAIGECGLDYFHPPAEGVSWPDYKARQADVFRAQLALAEARGLPVVVHHRGPDCWNDVVAMVRECGGRVKAQFHCYLDGWPEAEPLVAEGHRISFTGVVTYKNAGVVSECVRKAVAGSFFLETDAPYLAPVPHRGQRCEPAFVPDTAAFVAQARGQALEELESMTEAAVRSFFPRLG
ncbi:MAG: TatD family hydrolase [Verrucomicrobiales bacterium]